MSWICLASMVGIPDQLQDIMSGQKLLQTVGPYFGSMKSVGKCGFMQNQQKKIRETWDLKNKQGGLICSKTNRMGISWTMWWEYDGNIANKMMRFMGLPKRSFHLILYGWEADSQFMDDDPQSSTNRSFENCSRGALPKMVFGRLFEYWKWQHWGGMSNFLPHLDRTLII